MEILPYIEEKLSAPIFKVISEAADALGLETYVIGGFVRDLLLRRPSKDIDVVAVGDGIALAQEVARRLGKRAQFAFFKSYGTAQVKFREGIAGQARNDDEHRLDGDEYRRNDDEYRRNDDEIEIEFVGARRESYTRESRNPIVEPGTLQEDQNRRDFTINAMAICLNGNRFGEFVDPFNGLQDLNDCRLTTPLNPNITFCDDPLRMLRAVRFASQLGFDIERVTFDAIQLNAERIEIITQERIVEELNKIILSPRPSVGFELLELTGLLRLILPELTALKGIETKEGVGHKDNFSHTLKVLDNLARTSDNLWLRWAAVFHDIGKPRVKRFDPKLGWTFHGHEYKGKNMLKPIFQRMKFPLDDRLRYVETLVSLHMRPIALSDEEVTDSAVRRLLFDASDAVDDLMLLCEADITSKNPDKVRQFLQNFQIVRSKLKEIEAKDHVRNFQPPIDGLQIMEMFNLSPDRQLNAAGRLSFEHLRVVGDLKNAIKDAILDGVIPNEYDAAHAFLLQLAKEKGLPTA
ncbi:tRNA nucleotidyltransferase [Candidatus Symbiothrix dinenymphae]|nr:tRNA nucleotidyltransferase [Candidatus Symbiothrix dinenymphae]